MLTLLLHFYFDRVCTAEENLKNRLALAARGKLVQAKEDDKVKAERKKKAAMFAALLKKTGESVIRLNVI